ncbi:MAG TPA: holo-ACP synthase [Anaeromyxobacteraceae bacterium]|nr:holo-ACP synthase [Anaeromyxobacteraceae bacterium]
MIVALGMDVVAVDRIRRLVAPECGPRATRFLERCFTEAERAYCDARRDPATHYAARFAAKEAAMKALGASRFTDFEITRGDGAPSLTLHGAAAAAQAKLGGRVHLTLTHDAGVAAAVVVLEAP